MIKKGNTVLITTGKDKNKRGKILFVKKNKVIVEGLNLKKKHIKPKKGGQKGQIVEMPGPIDISNVKIICSNCKKATRTGIKIEIKEPRMGQKIKKQICKKCGKEI